MLSRTAVAVSADHVHGFLQKLGRAVQRASIYPPGHPAASLGLRPLVEALAALVADGPVTIAIGRTRLLASGSGLPPVEHRSRWLAARLFERHLAVITVSPDLDAVDLERLVAWLARHDGKRDAWPEFAGLTLSRFDGTRLRFFDDPDDNVETPDTERSWFALTAALRRSHAISDDCAALDPETLGDQIRHALEATEGMGISRLIEEIVNLHAGLAAHDDESRSSALLKLAVLVEHLAPEVSGALFRVTPEDSAEKLALIEDLLPLLSEPTLVDIAANVATAAAATHGPFSRFLRKLADVATDHPIVHEALDRRLAEVGVPASLFEGDGKYEGPVIDVAADGGSIDKRAEPEFLPAGYRARLDELAQASPSRAASAIDVQAFTEAALDEHLARISVHACRHDPSSETIDAYLRRLAGILPREAGRGNTGTMSAVAGLLLWLRSTRVPLASDALASVAALEGTFASPAALSMTLAAIDAAEPGEAYEASEWLIAGGVRAIEAVMNAIRSAPAPVIRLKLAAAVMALDEEAFATRVMPDLAIHPRTAEAFAHALGVVDPARAIVCAMTLATLRSQHVRRRAMAWLLSVPLSPGKARVVLPRALSEGDPQTTTVALAFAERYPTACVCQALVEFLAARAESHLVWAHARAIRIVVSAGDQNGHLAAALRLRTWRFRNADRAVSVTMASALAGLKSESSRVAVAAWRRSPARVLSVFTPPLQEAV